MATPFSSSLSRTRAWAGFKTAHEFYTRSGGRRVLNLSWVAYSKIEKGIILPKPERLNLLVSLLRLPPASARARELVRAYLRTLLGSEQAYDWVTSMAAQPRAAEGSSGIQERMLSRLLRAETYQLSYEQDQAIIADYASYWSFMVLCGGVDPWKVSDLASKLGIAKGELMRSLRKLSRVKVARFQDDGSVCCPLADKRVQLLPQTARSRRDMEKIQRYHALMAQKGGTLLWHAFSLPRASEAELAEFFPTLSRAVSAVHVFARHERAQGEPPSPQFLVEGLVYRLST